MATLASTIVLATLKPSVIDQFNELVNIQKTQGWEAATNKAIKIAIDFGFAHELPHPSYAIAMIGMNTNNDYTYVEEAVRDLVQGFDYKSGNCCYENTFRSHLIIPAMLSIYQAIATSYIIVAVDETRHSVLLTKNTEDLRPVYYHYAQEYIDKLGFEYQLELDNETRLIKHPNFDKSESYMLNLVNKNLNQG